mmetsp:Transcript_5220/g.9168  ORF Transcript_5220/g.9168 Transcript_5220/m.9168 type:complete len:151 (-) Transcript_5220:189-641(-)
MEPGLSNMTATSTNEVSLVDKAIEKSPDMIDENDDSKEGVKVSFSHVDIREYDIQIGNSPFCVGPAIELGWAYSIQQPLNIDLYEARREGKRREKMEMLVPSFYRIEKLREFGYSSKEIYQGHNMNKKKEGNMGMIFSKLRKKSKNNQAA